MVSARLLGFPTFPSVYLTACFPLLPPLPTVGVPGLSRAHPENIYLHLSFPSRLLFLFLCRRRWVGRLSLTTG